MKSLKSIITLLTVTVFLSGCNPGKQTMNTLTKKEKKDGWVLLFDGKTLNGWRGLGRDAVQTDHWKTEDGMIRKVNNNEVPRQADGKPVAGGDLMTI